MFLSDQKLGEGMTNVFSESFSVGVSPVSQGLVDVLVDRDIIDDKVLLNVVYEGSWVRESSCHLGELIKVSLDILAVSKSFLGLKSSLSQLLETFGHMDSIFLDKVMDGILSVSCDYSSILDASLDVVESLGVDGSLQEAFQEPCS